MPHPKKLYTAVFRLGDKTTKVIECLRNKNCVGKLEYWDKSGMEDCPVLRNKVSKLTFKGTTAQYTAVNRKEVVTWARGARSAYELMRKLLLCQH